MERKAAETDRPGEGKRKKAETETERDRASRTRRVGALENSRQKQIIDIRERNTERERETQRSKQMDLYSY